VTEHATTSDSLLFSSLRSSRNTRYFSRFGYTNPKQKRTISRNSCNNKIGELLERERAWCKRWRSGPHSCVHIYCCYFYLNFHYREKIKYRAMVINIVPAASLGRTQYRVLFSFLINY
jgi:hypothetical protein